MTLQGWFNTAHDRTATMTLVRHPLAVAYEPTNELEPFSVDVFSSEMQEEMLAWVCVSAEKHPSFLEVVLWWRMNYSQKVVEFGKGFPQNQKPKEISVFSLHD